MEVVEEPLDQQETEIMEPAMDAGPLPEPAPVELPAPEPEVQEPPKKARAKAKPRAKKADNAPPPEEAALPAVSIAASSVVAEAPAPRPKRAPRKPPPEPPAPHVPTLDEMVMAFQNHQYQRSMMRHAEYRSLIRM